MPLPAPLLPIVSTCHSRHDGGADECSLPAFRARSGAASVAVRVLAAPHNLLAVMPLLRPHGRARFIFYSPSGLLFCILPCSFTASLSLASSCFIQSPLWVNPSGVLEFVNLFYRQPCLPILSTGCHALSLHHYLKPGSVLYPAAKPWHKILKLCYYCIVGQGDLSSTPVRNNLCLAHGKSLMCFDLDQEADQTNKPTPSPRLWVRQVLVPLYNSKHQTI